MKEKAPLHHSLFSEVTLISEIFFLLDYHLQQIIKSPQERTCQKTIVGNNKKKYNQTTTPLQKG